MEFLRRVLSQIQNQLGTLTLSQKFAIALLLVLMCVAVYMMVDYSSQREMVQLLRQDFTQEELTVKKVMFSLRTFGSYLKPSAISTILVLR